LGVVHLLLLRHGESEWNALRRWQGIADVALTDRGRDQARRAAEVLARHYTDAARVAVWSSTLRRAVETAGVIAETLGTGPVHTDPRLVEADAGPWQGLTPLEIDAGWPDHRAAGRRPDGFEPRASVLARARAALADIAADARTGDQGIVVTHSGLIRTIVSEAGITDIAMPNLTGWRVDIDGHAVRVVEPFDPGDIGVDRRSTTTTLG
jgi:broad specificity phosphatase PhoE